MVNLAVSGVAGGFLSRPDVGLLVGVRLADDKTGDRTGVEGPT